MTRPVGTIEIVMTLGLPGACVSHRREATRETVIAVAREMAEAVRGEADEPRGQQE